MSKEMNETPIIELSPEQQLEQRKKAAQMAYDMIMRNRTFMIIACNDTKKIDGEVDLSGEGVFTGNKAHFEFFATAFLSTKGGMPDLMYSLIDKVHNNVKEKRKKWN